MMKDIAVVMRGERTVAGRFRLQSRDVGSVNMTASMRSAMREHHDQRRMIAQQAWGTLVHPYTGDIRRETYACWVAAKEGKGQE